MRPKVCAAQVINGVCELFGLAESLCVSIVLVPCSLFFL